MSLTLRPDKTTGLPFRSAPALGLWVLAVALASSGACRCAGIGPVVYPCENGRCASEDEFCGADNFCHPRDGGDFDAGNGGVDGGPPDGCVPLACSGAACGSLSDGCGAVLLCGDCAGNQRCGAGGVPNRCGDCGSFDEPDDFFLDTNCDGVDGDLDGGIFVSPTGNDADPGTREAPKATLTEAAIAAVDAGRKWIYAEGGEYAGHAWPWPVSVFGGYDRALSWARDDARRVRVNSPQAGFVMANIADPITFDRVDFSSADATGFGSASIGLRIGAATGVRLRHVSVRAGRGAQGSAGDPGDAGANGGAGTSQNPGPADSSCSSPGVAGGKGGGATVGAGSDGESVGGVPGGVGGSGGQCTAATCAVPCVGGTDGRPGGSGSVGLGGDAGADGDGGTSVGRFSFAFWWQPTRGAPGETGLPGTGGSGGGGGGGYVVSPSCSSTKGGAGGGGGAGGCGGAGGEGGGGGGASIGLMVVNARVWGEDLSIETQGGGGGGAGGAGGAGGTGGSAASGQPGDVHAGRGGDGAGGGQGGRGGHGGGGGGGPSIGLWCEFDGGVDLDGGATMVLGPAGAPGLGPASAGEAGRVLHSYGCP